MKKIEIISLVIFAVIILCNGLRIYNIEQTLSTLKENIKNHRHEIRIPDKIPDYNKKTSDDFTFNDKLWLSLNLYHEARSESFLGKVLIMKVVLNRVNHEDFSNTIEEVVKDDSQFSWYWDGKRDFPKNFNEYKKIVSEISQIYNFIQNNSDMYNDILYYHNTSVNPGWNNFKFRIDNHKFYGDIND